MLSISQFSFKAKDGIHVYLYNPNAKLSTFQLIQNNEIAYRHDCFCMTEYNHLKRIQNDFNETCTDLPDKFLFDLKYYWKRDKFKLLLFILLQMTEALNVNKIKQSTRDTEYFTFRD